MDHVVEAVGVDRLCRFVGGGTNDVDAAVVAWLRQIVGSVRCIHNNGAGVVVVVIIIVVGGQGATRGNPTHSTSGP